MTNTRVTLAAPADAPRVGRLFDLYRQFYEQAADLPGAIAYLQARLQNGESVVLMAETAEGQLAGFCQLYPTFCSVDMRRFACFTICLLPLTFVVRVSQSSC
ncbi:hypothetical protein ULF88_09660 [Halopseudomonas pachastrellae]|nr:hypothetical protein [Halopseudomonas pachastrellae]